MPNLGVPELVLLLVVLTLTFGARRVPGVARSIGQAIGALRHEIRDASTLRRDEPPTVDRMKR